MQNEKSPVEQKKRILVVEDQPVAAVVIKHMLNNLDYEVDIGSTGQSAIELVKEYPYDLIFMDIGLPDMDGYKVAKVIRDYEKDVEHKAPIIALTAHANSEIKQHCLDAGMNAALTKPLMQAALAEILKVFVPGHVPTPDASPMNEAIRSGIFTNIGKIVDIEAAQKVADMRKEAIVNFLRMFIEGFAKDEIKLDRAFYRHDWKEIQEITHKLRGSCDYCGAFKLKEACTRLNDYILSGEIAVRETFYQQMREEMQALKWYVDSIINKK